MHQKCIKNALNRLHDASKRLPRRLQDGPRRILPPFWAPTWGQVGAMLATFPAQDASMTPPRRSKMPSKILWIAQDGPRGLQTCPGALQTSILTDFWSIFGPFLIDFWLIFDTFFIDFSFHFNVKKQAFQHQKNNTLMLWCFVTLLLNHMRSVLGAVAGPQLCCALDT